MGCNASEPNVAVSADFGNRSPSQDCINDDKKTKLKKIIQKDNHTELALFLADKFVPLNAQISEPGQKWMLTHISCRFDAFNCLDYLLKHQFIESPVKYIDYVNAQNIDGSTCLHLCGIWKADKCFNVLYFYGGLHLTASDKNRKTPLEMAIQNRCKKMVDILQNHRDQGISFTLVETQKLAKGNLLAQDSNKNKAAQDAIFKNNQVLIQNGQSQQIKRLKQQKRKLQEQSKKIMQQKLDKEYQIQKQKAQLTKSLATNSQIKADTIKQNQEIKKKIQQSLKAEREKFKLQLQKKQEELRKVKDEMRMLQQKKVDTQKIQAQKIAENFSKQKQKEIKNMIEDKNKTVDKLKLQKQTEGQNPQKEKDQINKNEGQILTLDSLRQAFKDINQKLPPELQRKYSEALKNGQFFDSQFPAVEKSIGNREDQNFANFKSTVVWLRPYDIFPQGQQYVLFNGIDPNDIQQGQLGVCYMLATLSSLALYPEQIQKLFIYADTNVGFYVIKLFINGIPTFITIDDLIACNKSTNAPFFTRPVGNQLWVMLMQKVWAKAIGSYLSAQGMPIEEMMEDLSGAPSFGDLFADNQETGQSITTQIQTVVDYCNSGFNIVVGSYSDPPQGIVQGHAYTLMECFVVNETNVFKIRNPWGGTQWFGQYSQGSQLMTPQVIQQLGYTNQQDGVFFMSQSQLISCFEDYAVNINMGDYAFNYHQFSSKVNEDKFLKFKIKEKSSVNVRITQKFARMLSDKNYQYAPLVFEVGHIKSQKQVVFIDEGDKNTTFGAKSVHGFYNICEELQPGDYYVRVRMMWPTPQKYNTAVLVVYASQAVKIQQLQPGIGRKYLNLMLVNHLKSRDDIQYQNSIDGQGRFKICLMKGQYVFLLQTQKNNKYKPTVSIAQSQGLEPDFGKIDDYTAQGIVTKTDPCIVTFSYINLAQNVFASDIDIKFNKA